MITYAKYNPLSPSGPRHDRWISFCSMICAEYNKTILCDTIIRTEYFLQRCQTSLFSPQSWKNVIVLACILSFFPGHVPYSLYRGNGETFVTRLSRIGLNAIHEGWRVPDASRARYRSVREMRRPAPPCLTRARALADAAYTRGNRNYFLRFFLTAIARPRQTREFASWCPVRSSSR